MVEEVAAAAAAEGIIDVDAPQSSRFCSRFSHFQSDFVVSLN